MPFKIAAEFLFGYYQGHDGNGFVEKYPGPERLQSAFISAAYSVAAYRDEEGSAIKEDAKLNLPNDYAAAIKWFEANPPDAIRLPQSTVCEAISSVAYRKKGLFNSQHKAYGELPVGESAISRSALDGPIEWWWKELPDNRIQHSLYALCGEIAYLGEACSSVCITCEKAEWPSALLFERSDVRSIQDANSPTFLIPQEGRADSLEAAYRETMRNQNAVNKKPKVSNESEVVNGWVSKCLKKVSFVSSDSGEAFSYSPWDCGYLLNVQDESTIDGLWHPKEDQYTRWAVAVHETLVKNCRNRIPLILKGRRGGASITKMTANGVAIHIISEHDAGYVDDSIGINGTALLIMLPKKAQIIERSQVESAIGQLRKIYVKDSAGIKVADWQEVDLAHFWKTPAPGFQRWWRPRPVYLSDTRPIKGADTKGGWSLSDSFLVSIGYVWRDVVGPREPGDRGLVELKERVLDQGVKIVDARPLYMQHPQDYMHHMNKGSLFSAATALVQLGELEGDSNVAAIGQSRHLGGGLLVPVDIPGVPR